MIALIAATLAAAAPQAGTCLDAKSVDGLVCRALISERQGDEAAAAQAFESAAKMTPAGDPKAARLLTAAGNMWIAADQPDKAATDLDQALASPGLQGQQRGEALLDRARAAQSLGDLRTARARVTEAEATVGNDPFTWYFSAGLALREHDVAAAQASIGKALALAPNDPTILFEAGHVALEAGDEAQARSYWMRAAGNDNGEVGKAAAKAVEMLGVTPVVKMAPASPK